MREAFNRLVRECLDEIPNMPYSDDGGTGMPVDYDMGSIGKLSKDADGNCHCVGHTLAFVRKVLDKLDIKLEDMEYFNLWMWTYIRSDQIQSPTILGGAGRYLEMLGLTYPVYDLNDFQLGDILQKWDCLPSRKDDPSSYPGHSMIALGRYGTREGRPTVIVQSSQPASNGVGEDWYYLSWSERNRIMLGWRWDLAALKEKSGNNILS